MASIKIQSIGTIYSPYTESEGTPIQPGGSHQQGKLVVDPAFVKGLQDVEGFSHLIILYHLNRIKEELLLVKPFMDVVEHGIFATRSPARPNRIGLSVVELIKIEGNVMHVNNIDVLDGTPLIDIKPYVPHFDSVQTGKIGWFKGNVDKHKVVRDDARFV